MARIMVVEDEKQMQDILAEYMRRGGHSCVTAEDGVEALALLKQENADLLILDVMMPHLDGFTVCRLVRERSGIPIILLTAKAEEEDKLKGYEYGADDYMTKPFSPRVLLAKVNALLRRTSASALEAEALSAGKITLMPAARKVYVDGQEAVLTHLEYELLFFFLSNPGLVFTREQLLDRIWGYDFAGNSRTVDTHIKTLRQKLGEEGGFCIRTVRGVGYRFVKTEEG